MPHAAYHSLLQAAQRGTSVPQAVFRTAQHPSTKQSGMTAALQFALDHPTLLARVGGINTAQEAVRMLLEADDQVFEYVISRPGLLQTLPFERLHELFSCLLTTREKVGKRLLAFPGSTVHLVPEQRNKLFALRIPSLLSLNERNIDEAMCLKNGNRVALCERVWFVNDAGEPLSYSLMFAVLVAMHDTMDDATRRRLIASIAERALQRPQVGAVLHEVILSDMARKIDGRLVGNTPWHRQLLRACSPVLPMRIPKELDRLNEIIRQHLLRDRSVA